MNFDEIGNLRKEGELGIERKVYIPHDSDTKLG